MHEGDKHRDFAVLLTDVAYPLESIGKPDRDHADVENAFDQLKHQWGLGGLTTQDINRCQTVDRARVPVCNSWSWYCRAARPHAGRKPFPAAHCSWPQWAKQPGTPTGPRFA